MMIITAKAYAKLNLVLDVTGKLANGYHTIETVFQSVSLFDTVTVQNGMKKNTVKTKSTDIPDNGENICIKAANAFYAETGINDFAGIELKKQIPVAAGMAGGSADAAAVLLCLNKMHGEPLNLNALLRIALALGADVPFCLVGGTAAATGMGEKLTPLKPFTNADIIIIKQGKKPSTGELYGRLDAKNNIEHPSIKNAVTAIEAQNYEMLFKSTKNIFSSVWGSETERIKEDLLSRGAYCAELSGSGPAVFGIFENGTGKSKSEELIKKYKNVYLCSPKSCGVEFC